MRRGTGEGDKKREGEGDKKRKVGGGGGDKSEGDENTL